MNQLTLTLFFSHAILLDKFAHPEEWRDRPDEAPPTRSHWIGQPM